LSAAFVSLRLGDDTLDLFRLFNLQIESTSRLVLPVRARC